MCYIKSVVQMHITRFERKLSKQPQSLFQLGFFVVSYYDVV
jgi:hypothetical protein